MGKMEDLGEPHPKHISEECLRKRTVQLLSSPGPMESEVSDSSGTFHCLLSSLLRNLKLGWKII